MRCHVTPSYCQVQVPGHVKLDSELVPPSPLDPEDPCGGCWLLGDTLDNSPTVLDDSALLASELAADDVELEPGAANSELAAGTDEASPIVQHV